MREEHLPSNHALCLIEQPLNSTLVGGALRKLLQVPGAIECEVAKLDALDALFHHTQSVELQKGTPSGVREGCGGDGRLSPESMPGYTAQGIPYDGHK